jgi:hypothetical protein
MGLLTMKQTKVKAAQGERSVTVGDVYKKKTRPLSIPVRDVDTMESIVCGFRMGLIDAEVDGKRIGGVTSGSGLGSPWIHVEWKGKEIVVNAVELLRAHVAEVAPEDLPGFDKELAPKNG